MYAHQQGCCYKERWLSTYTLLKPTHGHQRGNLGLSRASPESRTLTHQIQRNQRQDTRPNHPSIHPKTPIHSQSKPSLPLTKHNTTLKYHALPSPPTPSPPASFSPPPQDSPLHSAQGPPPPPAPLPPLPPHPSHSPLYFHNHPCPP